MFDVRFGRKVRKKTNRTLNGETARPRVLRATSNGHSGGRCLNDFTRTTYNGISGRRPRRFRMERGRKRSSPPNTARRLRIRTADSRHAPVRKTYVPHPVFGNTAKHRRSDRLVLDGTNASRRVNARRTVRNFHAVFYRFYFASTVNATRCVSFKDLPPTRIKYVLHASRYRGKRERARVIRQRAQKPPTRFVYTDPVTRCTSGHFRCFCLLCIS